MKKFLLSVIVVLCIVLSATSCKKGPSLPEITVENYRFTCSGATVKATLLLGTTPSGTIYWGDGDSQDWTEDAVHNYTDGITEHTIEIQTPATGFELASMSGVSGIEI